MTILQKCAAGFREGRLNLILATALLYEIRQKELWADGYESMAQYVEEECKMSKAQASKLLTSYEHFAVNGGVSHAKLAQVDPEKLYLAITLKGSHEKQLAQALSLTRTELTQQKVYEKTGEECKHPEVIRICAKCHQRVE